MRCHFIYILKLRSTTADPLPYFKIKSFKPSTYSMVNINDVAWTTISYMDVPLLYLTSDRIPLAAKTFH